MLRLQVPLLPGETATSFCSRLAFRNMAGSISEFCLDLDLPLPRIIQGDPDALAALAELGGVDPALLAASTLRSDHNGIRIGTNLIDQTIRRPMEELVVCPACLAEDVAGRRDLGIAAAAGRVAWMLMPITTCTQHGLKLVSVGKAPPGWDGRNQAYDFTRRAKLFLCDIEAQLAAAVACPSTGLELHLAGRLDGTAGTAGGLVDRLPFYAIAQASLLVGAFETLGRKFTLKGLHDEDRRAAGAVGFSILASGTDVLFTRLREAMDRWPRGKNAAGPGAFFGSFHTWLANRRDAPAFDFLRSMIKDLMISTRAMHPGYLIFGESAGERRLQSVRTAAVETGLHPKRLKRLLISKGILDPRALDVSAHLAVFPSTPEAKEILATLQRCISTDEAQIYINASKRQFQAMRAAGLVAPFTGPDGTLKNFGFDTLVLDEFLCRLMTNTKGKPPPARSLMTIAEIANRYRGTKTVSIIQAVLDGRLTTLHQRPGLTGVASILIDPAEFDRVMAWRLPGMSIKEVTHRLHCEAITVTDLIRGEHLPAQKVLNPHKNRLWWMIEPEDCKAFERTYVALGVVARKHQTNLPEMKRQLQDVGVTPAFNPARLRTTFYRRADIPEPTQAGASPRRRPKSKAATGAK